MKKSVYKFKEIDSEKWKETIAYIQLYAELVSSIKSEFTFHQKNWEEFSLKVYAKGLTTTPVPVEVNGNVEALDLNLNFIEHQLKIFCSDKRLSLVLDKYNIRQFRFELEGIFKDVGINYKFPDKNIEEIPGFYHKDAALEYWNILKQVYFIMLRFKSRLLEETSNINFWPHHMDLALLVFNGRLIPGQDPENWDYSRQQMNFGFSPGDEGIPEPYFYITAYPFPKEIISKSLPGNAYWHKENWNGAVLKYQFLVQDSKPGDTVINFFTHVKNIIEDARK